MLDQQLLRNLAVLDKDPSVRINAINKLDITSSKTLKILKELSYMDKDPSVRLAALDRLEKA